MYLSVNQSLNMLIDAREGTLERDTRTNRSYPPTLEHSCAFEGIFKNFLIFYTKRKKPRETNVNSTSVVSFDCEDLFSLRCSYVL